jgi:microcystin-dependent protein
MSNPYLPDSGDVAYGNQLGDFTPAPPTGPLYSSGMMITIAGATIPDGWYLCNGQVLTVLGNQDLYDVIGNLFDISGSPPPAGSFTLPDMRGRSAQFLAPVGDISGDTEVVLTAQNLPAHRHTANNGTVLVAELVGGAFPSTPLSGTLQTRVSSGAIKDASGNDIPQPPQPIQIMNPFLVLNWIIKK